MLNKCKEITVIFVTHTITTQKSNYGNIYTSGRIAFIYLCFGHNSLSNYQEANRAYYTKEDNPTAKDIMPERRNDQESGYGYTVI